jgi:integrase
MTVAAPHPHSRRQNRLFNPECDAPRGRLPHGRRRTAEAGFKTKLGCHTFRATGLTAYLEVGGTLENAQAMVAHESPRTTELYDRTDDAITPDEVERIII